MSLAKYVDLLRSQTLFLPKASLFSDNTEGKWIAHAYLWNQKRRRIQLENKISVLETILKKTNAASDALLAEATNTYENLDTAERKSTLGEVLSGLRHIYPHKRLEYINGLVNNWTKLRNAHNDDVHQWTQSVEASRESTYISCWNSSESMSLAMWNQYGEGMEGIAIRSTVKKLESLIEHNKNWLIKNGLSAKLTPVTYEECLMQPDHGQVENLLQRLTMAEDPRVGQFSVKPSIFQYEQELRLIAYPQRNIHEQLIDSQSDRNGFALPISFNDYTGSQAQMLFDAVYLHPLLEPDSMMEKVVRELNRHFIPEGTPIYIDKINAMNNDLMLSPYSPESK